MLNFLTKSVFCGTMELEIDELIMTNAEIADIFEKIASILEIQEENRFRIRAYQQAGQMIIGLPQELSDICKEGGKEAIDKLPGIGKDLASKIIELIQTGRLNFFVQLKKKVPSGLLEIMEIGGMGPKTTRYVWKEYGVKTIKQLEGLAKSGKLEKREGFGEKKVLNILRALEQYKKFGERVPIQFVLPLAEDIAEALQKSKLASRVEIAGSLRRFKDTIGDIDILAISKKPKQLMDFFANLPQVKQVTSKGDARTTIVLKNGMDCDLRVFSPEEFGAGLYYFTGSKEHNIAVRTIAVRRGLTISEYGIFKGTKERKGRRAAGRTEEEIFKTLKLQYIPPEIRENSGEIEKALEGKIKRLIEEKDIKGDLHLHTNWSTEVEVSPIEMIRAAKAFGRSYIAITDHASKMGIAHGITFSNIRKYISSLRKGARKVGGIHVLAGVEVDIEKDGSLYLPDKTLSELDFVIAAIHLGFRQSKNEATKRLLRVIENPHVDCIGHPTTRILGRRPEMEFEWDKLFKCARDHHTAFELNASLRLDLSSVLCRQAKEYGAKISLGSDAHSKEELDLFYGVGTARRGWLEKLDVINTKTWSEFKRWLSK